MEDSLVYKIEVENEYNTLLKNRSFLQRAYKVAEDLGHGKMIVEKQIESVEAKIEILERIIKKCHG